MSSWPTTDQEELEVAADALAAVTDGATPRVQRDDRPARMCSTADVADLNELNRRIGEFLDARDWRRHHTPKNLAMALTGEVGELVEILQWLTPEDAARAGTDPTLRARLEDELADVLIYLASLANSLDIDLLEVALAKVKRNETRFPPGRQPTS